MKSIDVDRLNELETIDPRPLPSWRSVAFTESELEHDRETARERAESARNTSDIVVYSDASGREGPLEAAIVALNDDNEMMEPEQIQSCIWLSFKDGEGVRLGRVDYSIGICATTRKNHQRYFLKSREHE